MRGSSSLKTTGGWVAFDIQGSDITLGCLWRLRMSAHGCKLEVASLFEVRGCVVNFNIHEILKIYIKVDFRLRAAAGKRTPELRLHARRPQRAKRGPAWHSRKIPCTALAALGVTWWHLSTLVSELARGSLS